MITHISGMYYPILSVSADRGVIIGDPVDSYDELGDRLAWRSADRHEVEVVFAGAWPGVGRCDSCGRIIVRGMGRWWERGQWR